MYDMSCVYCVNVLAYACQACHMLASTFGLTHVRLGQNLGSKVACRVKPVPAASGGLYWAEAGQAEG